MIIVNIKNPNDKKVNSTNYWIIMVKKMRKTQKIILKISKKILNKQKNKKNN